MSDAEEVFDFSQVGGALEGLHERQGRERLAGDDEREEASSVEILLEEEGALGASESILSGGEWEVKWQLLWAVLSLALPSLLWIEDVATLFLQETCFTSTTCSCDNLLLFTVFLLVLVCVGAVLAGLGAAHSSRTLQATGWSLREHARLVDVGEEAFTIFSTATQPRVRGAAQWIDEQLHAKKGTLERLAPTVVKVFLVVGFTAPLITIGIAWAFLHRFKTDVALFSLGCLGLMLPILVCAVVMMRRGKAVTFLLFLFFAPIPVMVMIDIATSMHDLLFAVVLVGGSLAVIVIAWFFRNALASWLQQGNSVLSSRGRVVGVFMLALMPAGALFESDNTGGRRQALLMATSYAALAHFACFLVSIIVFAGFPLRTCLLTKELVALALISCITIATLALVNAVLRALPHISRPKSSER